MWEKVRDGLAKVGARVEAEGVRTVGWVRYRTDLMFTDRVVSRAMENLGGVAQLVCVDGGREMWAEIKTPKRRSDLEVGLWLLALALFLAFFWYPLLTALEEAV